ncbi:MAG: OmpA family protein [Prevotella sp.]|nr:OmpA family protein [Prevotella sp.]
MHNKYFCLAITLILLASCGTYESHMKKAEAFMALGEYYDAGEEYRMAYRLVPSRDKERRGLVSLKMGNTYYLLNSPSRAVGAYRNAVRYEVTDSLTHLRLGRMLMMNGAYKEAVDVFEEGLDTMPHPANNVAKNHKVTSAKDKKKVATTKQGKIDKQDKDRQKALQQTVKTREQERKELLKQKEQARKIKEKARKMRAKDREKLLKERAKQRKKGIKVGPLPPPVPLEEYTKRLTPDEKIETLNTSAGAMTPTETSRQEKSDTIMLSKDTTTVDTHGSPPNATKRNITPSIRQQLESGLQGALMAPDWKNEGSAYTVKKDQQFNGRRSDFSPMLMGTDGEYLYFTSTRNEASGDEYNGITGIKSGDIFFSHKDDKGKWSRPEAVTGGLNTEYDEGATTVTSDNSTMYITQCATDPSYPRYAQIMTSRRSDAAWSAPTRLELSHDTLSSFAHPAVSADGEWLYFVSDMPGGEGGLDLWRIRLSQIGIGGVENLGPEINTAGDEMFPTFRANGDLYFSSNGRPGMGGLDIFIARTDSAGHWRVEHPGYPLNSMGDDFGMTFEGVYNRGYFSSNRGDGKGWDHLYTFEKDEYLQILKGWVYEDGGYELPSSLVYLVGNDGTNMKINVQSDGSFTQVITPGVDYVMLATCRGHLNHKEEIRVTQLKESHEYVLQFPLASISAPVLIDNIFYDFDKATLREESFPSLDRLVTLLEENPNITIELGAHTDYHGAEAYNERLSQRRAEAVCAYLIEKGIKADRLTAKGYGESTPKKVPKKLTETYDWLKEGDELTEAFTLAQEDKEKQKICDQLNRRTEFRVLRTTYGLFDKK